MTLLNHDLAHEFPQYLEKMRALNSSDPRFASLVAQFDAHNLTITRLEQGGAAMTDEAFEALKKKRLKIKDEIFQILQAR